MQKLLSIQNALSKVRKRDSKESPNARRKMSPRFTRFPLLCDP